MRIQINGEQREFAQSSMKLSELIDELSLAPQRIAVEVNHQIARKQDWHNTALSDGDRIEIVHFVGGGSEGPRVSKGALRIQSRPGVEFSQLNTKETFYSCQQQQPQ